MKLEPKDIRIDGTPNAFKRGMKVGTPLCWMTITHQPSMQCVRVLQNENESQHRCRDRAMALLELLMDDFEDTQFIHREQFDGSD
tara:strand:- start:1105 stop:1359 length:255 start_codon:yes stop_codon:yes gene_type:complete